MRTKFFSGFGKKIYWKNGTALEIFRFSVYLAAPIFASVVYANPLLMHDIIQKLRLVEYPESAPAPPVGDDIYKYSSDPSSHRKS